MTVAIGDRDNFSGDLALTVPTGGVVKGSIYNIQNAYVVARETADAAAVAKFGVLGPIMVKKETGTVAIGQKLYFKSSTKTVTTAATGNTLLDAIPLAAAASGDAGVFVNLCGLSPALT
jgi:predicted RecA/RadA family phage recombinase